MDTVLYLGGVINCTPCVFNELPSNLPVLYSIVLSLITNIFTNATFSNNQR